MRESLISCLVIFMPKLSPRAKLGRARATLLQEKPFFGHLLMYLDFKENEDMPKTMGVEEGGVIHYHPGFIEDEDDEDTVKFYLAHEVMHLSLDSFGRQGNRKAMAIDKETGQPVTLWNLATDYAINDILSKEGFKVEGNGLLDQKFRGKSAEEIYEQINDEISEKESVKTGFDEHYPDSRSGEKDGGKGDSEGRQSGSPSDKSGKPPGSDGEDEAREGVDKAKALDERRKARAEEWKRRIAQAYRHAETKGDLPGELGTLVEDLVNPKLNWKAILNQYVSHELIYDTSFRRPSKKSYAVGSYLPKEYRENLEITVAIDTSGSINDKLLQIFLSEVKAILHSFESIKMTLILADAAVHEVHDLGMYSNVSVEDLTMKGRGGTDHRPVFKWISEKRPNTQLAVLLTDGYTEFPDNEPLFASIWVITSDGIERNKVPFGKSIKLPRDE